MNGRTFGEINGIRQDRRRDHHGGEIALVMQVDGKSLG